MLVTPGRKILRLVLATILMAGGLIVAGLADSAAAATARNGVCEQGEFCLYYFSNRQGSVSDFSSSVRDYGSSQPSCYEFRGEGAGQGMCVKNNAMSAWNRSSRAVTVYYNSGYSGLSQTFASGQAADLVEGLANQNASHRFR